VKHVRTGTGDTASEMRRSAHADVERERAAGYRRRGPIHVVPEFTGECWCKPRRERLDGTLWRSCYPHEEALVVVHDRPVLA
jgi:hypothetical protein